MDNMHSFWQLGDELRGHSKVAEDHEWLMVASKLAEQTSLKGERLNNLDLSKGLVETSSKDKFGFQEDNKLHTLNFSLLNLDPKINENMTKASLQSGLYNTNAVYQKNNGTLGGNMNINKYNGNVHSKESNHNSSDVTNSNAADKRFKTLPASETLPRNEVLGGYIFVCNNDTMQEDLKRQLFGNCEILNFTFFVTHIGIKLIIV